MSETDFRLKKYMTNETYIFRQVNMSVIDDIKEWKSLDYQFFNKIQIYVFRLLLTFHRLPLPRSHASILLLIQKKREVKKMEWTASDPKKIRIPCLLAISLVHFENFCILFWPLGARNGLYR